MFVVNLKDKAFNSIHFYAFGAKQYLYSVCCVDRISEMVMQRIIGMSFSSRNTGELICPEKETAAMSMPISLFTQLRKASYTAAIHSSGSCSTQPALGE
jgi:hypothetical protein